MKKDMEKYNFEIQKEDMLKQQREEQIEILKNEVHDIDHILVTI